MAEGMEKEVYFNKYCELCKNKDVDEHEDPCDTCLSEPTNINSHRPILFEDKDA